jgi:hypothetical protein
MEAISGTQLAQARLGFVLRGEAALEKHGSGAIHTRFSWREARVVLGAVGTGRPQADENSRPLAIPIS